jgi:hypothetical protein
VLICTSEYLNAEYPPDLADIRAKGETEQPKNGFRRPMQNNTQIHDTVSIGYFKDACVEMHPFSQSGRTCLGSMLAICFHPSHCARSND